MAAACHAAPWRRQLCLAWPGGNATTQRADAQSFESNKPVVLPSADNAFLVSNYNSWGGAVVLSVPMSTDGVQLFSADNAFLVFNYNSWGVTVVLCAPNAN